MANSIVRIEAPRKSGSEKLGACHALSGSWEDLDRSSVTPGCRAAPSKGRIIAQVEAIDGGVGRTPFVCAHSVQGLKYRHIYRTITVAWVLKDWAKEFHEFPSTYTKEGRM